MTENFDRAVAMTQAARRIAESLVGVLSYETVQHEVAVDYGRLARGARVRRFLPVLVERSTRQRLRAALADPGSRASTVLFVCTRNAGRSQMAAALTRRAAGSELVVRSAGTAPSSTIQPEVLAVMAEIGIDLREQSPAPLTPSLLRDADAIVTLGCGDAVPVLDGRRYADWGIDDPFGRSLDEVRAIRDEIGLKVSELLTEITPARTTPAV